MTTKDRVQEYLKAYDNWIPLHQLEDMHHQWNTTGSTIARRCRELENPPDPKESPKIEKMYKRGLNGQRITMYRVLRHRMNADQANQYLEKLRLEEERDRQGALL